MLTRLNKYISDSGVASRRKAESFIIDGRVAVNNQIVMDLAFKVDSEKDEVTVDGEKINPKRHVYFLLNKPKGIITSTDDEKNRMTVVDLVKSSERIYPVGRLDYNTTGVLFLTNDGNFSNLLTHPGNKVPRTYEVKINRPLLDEDLKTLLKGVYLEGVKGKFIKVTFPKVNSRTIVEVTGVEGRNHFVKKMFNTLGYNVINLNRKSYAGIIADIPVGTFRKLTTEEVTRIRNTYGK